MTCPNCGSPVPEDSNFCKNCGFNFRSIPQVEPIRVSVEPEEPTVVVPPKPEEPRFVPPATAQQQPQIIVQRSYNAPLIALLTVTILIAAAALAFFAYAYLQQNKQTAVANVQTNIQPATPKPSPIARPTDEYEDWRSAVAPEDRRAVVFDEMFTLSPGSYRSVNFSIPDGAVNPRVVGGLKVTGGEAINFFVYPAEAFDDYPTNGLKPVHLEQIRNKKINTPLRPGDYVLVFESLPNAVRPATIASEILVVSD